MVNRWHARHRPKKQKWDVPRGRVMASGGTSQQADAVAYWQDGDVPGGRRSDTCMLVYP